MLNKALSRLNNSLTKKPSIVDPRETKSHSFVLKIWVREPPRHDETPIWRGRITHVMEGRYKYVKTLTELIQFMIPYFNDMGIQIHIEGILNSDIARLGSGKQEK